MADPDGFESHNTRVSMPVFLGILWTLTGLSFIFVAFRITVHVHSFRRLWLDDFLSIIAWVIMLTAAILWQIEGGTLYHIYAIDDGEEQLAPEFLDKYVRFFRFTAPYQILFFTGLWCIKFGFMVFFYRLRSKVRTHQVWYWVVLFFTASVYIVCMGIIEYKCSFGGAEYILNECPKMHHIHYEQRTFWSMCAGDVITDLMSWLLQPFCHRSHLTVLIALVLSIPVVTLWDTKISRRHKIILFSIFSATILVMVIAILRVAVDTSLNTPVNLGWLIFWSFIEINTAIIISCAVSLRQIFVKSKKKSSRPSAASSNITPKKVYPKLHGRSTGDIEPHNSDEVMLSPMSDVHVRRDFEVTSAPVARSGNGENLFRHQKSFE